jgi:ABC-type nitrate/sulfonate/bicarbonate transport system substrate-binding protein
MRRSNRILIIVICLSAVALLALVSGILRKKSVHVGKDVEPGTVLRCAYDGTRINPLYQVDAYLGDDTVARFCSIANAMRWLENNRDKVLYFTVVDEATGQKFDSSLGHFVESDVVTVPEVKNRLHVFFSRGDAEKHAEQFNGRILPNPLGKAFELPKVAQLDTLTVGAPLLPDALPLRLAIFRPIFKENKISVTIIPFSGEEAGLKLLAGGAAEALLCDLPTGLLLAESDPSARIVKNVLRANPFRPLFALVAGPNSAVKEISQLEGKTVAVPRGVNFRFYLEFYLRQAGMSVDKLTIREVDDAARAWELLNKGETAAALLRTPYAEIAMEKGMAFLADDRSLPWMSVLVVRQSVIQEKFEVIKRFIYSLEQAVLALNLKPDEYLSLLREQGGIPGAFRSTFPMPIFEGANAPSPDELLAVSDWLVSAGHLTRRPAYDRVVDTRFLPDPNGVGLAFCCR